MICVLWLAPYYSRGALGMGGIMHLCYYVYYDYDVTTPDFFVFFYSSLSSRFRHKMLFEGNR